MLTLFTDLDDTLIYGHRVLGKSEDTVLIETLEGRPLSYMTSTSHNIFCEIMDDQDVVVVPVTTRDERQFNRLQFPKMKYALVCNGGKLLVDGAVDAEWQKESEELVQPYTEELRRLLFVVAGSGFKHSSWALRDYMFLCGKFENPTGVRDYIKQRIVETDFSVYVQHQKVYIIPSVLEKGKALERFCRRYETGYKVSAGDNLIDFSMAEYSDIFITSNGTGGVARKSILVSNEMLSDYMLNQVQLYRNFGGF